MKKHRCWIIAVTIILTGILYVGYGFAKENEPIREPVYESPRVYTNSNGKVVFKEFFEGLTVNRIEFFDPDSGELLYGVSLQGGKLVGQREGSAVGENKGPFDESGDFVENKYLTHSGKTGFAIKEHNGELVVYRVRGIGTSNPLHLSIYLEKGRILRALRKFFLNNELVEFKRNFAPDTYEELFFHNDGSRTKREYKFGFLRHEAHRIPAKGGGNLTPYNNAYYMQGKHAFTIKSKFNKENYKVEIAVFDAQDKLVGKANPVFGERLYLKEEVVNGRKALQVIRHGQDRREKVEAVKFEDE